MQTTNTFKGVAYEILKEAGVPLHSDEITERALRLGWLKTAGKTPNQTMNAQLVVDVNKRGARLFQNFVCNSFESICGLHLEFLPLLAREFAILS